MYVRATTNGVRMTNANAEPGHRSVELRIGDLYAADHWAVREAPDRFEPVDLSWQGQEAAQALIDARADIGQLVERLGVNRTTWSDGHQERAARMQRRMDAMRAQIDAEAGQRATLLQHAQDPARTETAPDPAAARSTGTTPTRTDPVGVMRDNARRTLDQLRHVPDAGRELLERSFVHAEAREAQDDTELTALSRWLRATGSPAYARAVGKLFADPQDGHREFTTDELDAYRTARQVQRAMSIGTGSAGGFLLPTHLDPAIMLSSAGAIDPVRRVARNAVIATNVWNGVSSDGVTASWYAEAAEVTDDSPTLADPSVETHKASSFVAASIEASQDTAISLELAGLFADAKANLEAGSFATGTGTGEPNGIVTALTGTASSVDTAAVNAYARADIIGLAEAVPARFRSRGRYMMSLGVLNATREFPKLEGGTENSLVDDGGPVPRLRGWAVEENSSFADFATTTGTKLAVAGDFSSYLVVDRVGATVEFIPHLLGANRRPTLQRGWVMFWRTGGDQLVANALRLLNVDGA